MQSVTTGKGLYISVPSAESYSKLQLADVFLIWLVLFGKEVLGLHTFLFSCFLSFNYPSV